MNTIYTRTSPQKIKKSAFTFNITATLKKKNTDIRQDCSDTGDGIVILKVINIGFSGMSDFR